MSYVPPRHNLQKKKNNNIFWLFFSEGVKCNGRSNIFLQKFSEFKNYPPKNHFFPKILFLGFCTNYSYVFLKQKLIISLIIPFIIFSWEGATNVSAGAGLANPAQGIFATRPPEASVFKIKHGKITIKVL